MKRLSTALSFFLFLVLTFSFADVPAQSNVKISPDLLASASEQGQIPVIIELELDIMTGSLDQPWMKKQRNNIIQTTAASCFVRDVNA